MLPYVKERAGTVSQPLRVWITVDIWFITKKEIRIYGSDVQETEIH